MQRIDHNRLRQRILLNLIGDNFVIFPLGVGVSLAFATWAFNLEPQLLFWFISGMVGLLGPIGGLVTKWATGMDKLSLRALEEIQAETHQAQEQELDQLQNQLVADGDARTEQMLTDLRAIHQSFKQELATTERSRLIAGGMELDIIYKVDQLYVESVKCLGNTITLINKSEEAATDTVKASILEKRESIISEVKQAIDQLSQIYTELLTLDPDGNPSRLSQLRNELDANIEFARKVDQNVRNLDQDKLFEPSEYDEFISE